MKKLVIRLSTPILNYFESLEGEFSYKKSHRNILIIVGFLFLAISLGSLYLAIQESRIGGAIPAVIFLLAGVVCEVVGFLGSDRAVAKIWKSK